MTPSFIGVQEGAGLIEAATRMRPGEAARRAVLCRAGASGARMVRWTTRSPEARCCGARLWGTPVNGIAVPVAGDGEGFKRVVRAMVDEPGSDRVDAGGIDESWRRQPATPVYGLRAGVEAPGARGGLPERPEAHRA